jgi:hypothetical protein
VETGIVKPIDILISDSKKTVGFCTVEKWVARRLYVLG